MAPGIMVLNWEEWEAGSAIWRERPKEWEKRAFNCMGPEV